ncbi:AAA family ATPase [uncultured Thermosynechococcus sp.]
MKLITLDHHKGDAGKTTVIVNIAADFRRRCKRVLIIT